MGLEAVTFVDDLVITNPVSTDPISQGDDHLKNIKTALDNTFPGLAGRLSRIQSKSANYTVLLTDNTTLIVTTASLTLSLTAAASLGNGFLLFVYNNSQTITVIDPNGAELINGFSTFNVYPRQFAIVFCDGAAFSVLNKTEPLYVNPLMNSNMGIWGKKISTLTATTLNTPVFGPVGYRLDVSAVSAMVTMARSTVVPTVTESSIFPVTSIEMINQSAKAAFAATEYCFFSGVIEGFDVQNIAQVPFNLTFWVKTSATGDYNLSIVNSGLDRSYVKSFQISAINTWEFKQFLIPASPSLGTWDYSSGVGMRVRIALGAGSSFIVTTDDAWTAVNALGSTANVNFNAVISASINVTAMHIWKGNDFKLWSTSSRKEELERTRRQYFKSFDIDQTATVNQGTANAIMSVLTSNGINVGLGLVFPTEMRTTPTISLFNPSNTGTTTGILSTGSSLSLTNIITNSKMVLINNDAVAVGNVFLYYHLVADARL